MKECLIWKEKTWRKSGISFNGKVSDAVQSGTTTSDTLTQKALLEQQGQQQGQQLIQDQNNQTGKKDFINQKIVLKIVLVLDFRSQKQ